MSEPTTPVDDMRRALMRQAACVASRCGAAALTAGALGVDTARAQGADASTSIRRYARSQLVDATMRPLTARRVTSDETWLFNYPYKATPVFLVALRQAPRPAGLQTQAQQRYEAPAGVGPARSLVAFSAICAHKLVYPTGALSFIGVRKGRGTEPEQVIHCCADASRYDATRGARVMAGPASQPLAAVVIEWEAATDHLYAVGVLGGELFDAFFDKYKAKLELDIGPTARELIGGQTVAQPASTFSRQWTTCST